jgi:hypothetical protein
MSTVGRVAVLVTWISFACFIQEDLHPWDATPPGRLGPRQRAVVCVVLFCLLTPALIHLLRAQLLAWRRAGCPTGRTGLRWGRDPYCAPPAPAPPPVGFNVVATDFDALLGHALHGLPEDAHTGACVRLHPPLPQMPSVLSLRRCSLLRSLLLMLLLLRLGGI